MSTVFAVIRRKNADGTEDKGLLDRVFSLLALFSFGYALFTGRIEEVSTAVLDGASRAVEVTLALLGVMSLWTGLMKVFEASGAIEKLGRLFRPLMKVLFPEASRDSQTISAIVSCFAANLLGIGNAATPLGIEAVKRLQKGDPTAKKETVLLTVMNCASFSLVPTTVIALRRGAGALILFEILPAVWLTGIVGTLAAILAVKLLCRS